MSVVLAVPHKALLFISVPYSTSCFLAMYFGLPDCTTLCTIDKVWYATICMIEIVPVQEFLVWRSFSCTS